MNRRQAMEHYLSVVRDCLEEGISVNSTAFLEEEKEGEKLKGVGNPTEVASLLWLKRQGKNYLHLREESPVIANWQSPQGNICIRRYALVT